MADGPEGYGGATPPSQPGGVPPGSAKPVAELNDALKTMSQLTESNTQVMQALLQHLNRVSGASKEMGKNYDYAHMELKSLLKDTANLEYSMKRIQKLQAARVAGGASRSGTVEYVKNLQAEYKILLQVMNTGRGQGRYVKDIEKALDGLDKKLKQVEKQNDRTWDPDQIREINDELKRTAKHVQQVAAALSTVQVGKMTQGFKDMGRAIDDAFDSQFSQTLQKIPGVAGLMKGLRVAKQAGVAHGELGRLASERKQNLQAVWRANAPNVYAQHGRAGLNTMRKMGFAGKMPPLPTYKGARRGGPLAATGAGGSNVAAKQGGALDQMNVKVLTVQRLVVGSAGRSTETQASTGKKAKARLDPQTGKYLNDQGVPINMATGQPEAPAQGKRRKFDLSGLRERFNATTSPEDVQKTIHGSGGLFSRSINKLVSGMAEREGGFGSVWAKNRIARGAGSASAGLAEGALGTGSSLLRGGMGLASRAAVPLAIAGALVSLRDKIAEENKKIEGTFAGLGGFSSGGSADFHGIRKTMLSTGFSSALRMGQGAEENMKLMGTLGESGLALGGTLARGKDLGAALEDRGLGPNASQTGGGFYGSVMKNAVYSGKNLGMGQDVSARLTMKLIEKFGQTTQETQKFFLGLDTMMQHSGVSASKYIEVIDDVTGQFNDMNKSLNATLGILNALGKGGRLTGDTMKDLLKTLQNPTQMNTAQRMFNAQGMSASGDAGSAAASLRNANKNELAEMAETLSKDIGDELTGGASGKDILKNRTAIERRLAERYAGDPGELQAKTKMLDEKIKRISTQSAQAEALSSGNPAAIASVMEMGGESGASAMFARRSNVRRIGQVAGLGGDDMQKLLSGDQDMIKRVMKNQLVAQLQQQGTLMGGEDLIKYANASGNMARQGGLSAVAFGREGKSAAQFAAGDLNDQSKFQTMLELQRARGKSQKKKDGTEDQDAMVQAFIDEASKSDESADKLATEITNLDETFKLMVTTGSALQKAIQKQIDEKTAEEGKAKAQALADNTRTTAEVFAKSFEYLFDKVINFLDKMMDFLSPGKWLQSKKDNEWSENRSRILTNAINTMDTTGMSEEQRKEHSELKQIANSGDLNSGTSEERDRKQKSWIARMKRLNPTYGQSVENYLWSAEQARIDGKAQTSVDTGEGYSVGQDRAAASSFSTMESYLKAEGGPDIGSILSSLAGKEGGGLMGYLDQNGMWSDIQKRSDKDHTVVTAGSQGATDFFEQAAKRFPQFVQKSTEGGKTVYNIYNSSHINSTKTVADVGAGSQEKSAQKVGQ